MMRSKRFLDQINAQHDEIKANYDKEFDIKRRKITQGDDLAPGVQKIVKVYLSGTSSPTAR